MGALRIILWSIIGPLLIWLALLAHVFYQFAFNDPLPVKVAGWPSGTDESVKNILIQNRKYILQDFKDAISKDDKKKMKSFIDNRLTDDFIWEDPTMKLIGKDEFEDMMGLSKYVSDVEFEVLSERHSTHEMLLDWKLKIHMKHLPSYPLTLPMRTHFLLEPAESLGSGEKLFKIYEEWYGHEHMNQSNTKPSILGFIHQNLRRFSGQGFSWLMRKGVL